jgi:hypothetical protein
MKGSSDMAMHFQPMMWSFPPRLHGRNGWLLPLTFDRVASNALTSTRSEVNFTGELIFSSKFNRTFAR